MARKRVGVHGLKGSVNKQGPAPSKMTGVHTLAMASGNTAPKSDSPCKKVRTLADIVADTYEQTPSKRTKLSPDYQNDEYVDDIANAMAAGEDEDEKQD